MGKGERQHSPQNLSKANQSFVSSMNFVAKRFPISFCAAVSKWTLSPM
jgi:hypothetical protein